MARPTAARIVAAARRLLERDGREAVSMRRVGGTVGITAMAIYGHYPDRAALLDAVANQGFAELAGVLARTRFPAGFEPRLLKMADLYVEHALGHPRLFELMFLAPREGARRYPHDFKAGRSPTANLLVPVLQDAMARGEVRVDDPWEITFEIGALLEGLVMLYLGGRIDAGPRQLRALIRRSLRRHLHGICT
ncbi:MAG TPA: TetR/AcrR family transcriptional regulator [Kofleriaceae bacterium]|jgi:AcrR family transcriptional regulator